MKPSEHLKQQAQYVAQQGEIQDVNSKAYSAHLIQHAILVAAEQLARAIEELPLEQARCKNCGHLNAGCYHCGDPQIPPFEGIKE